MFELIRKNSKVLAVPLFILIILAFVLVGVNGYNGLGGSAAKVATVGSRSISQAEWDNAHKQEVDQLRSSMPNLDPKMLDSDEAKYATLERLVKESVLEEAVKKLHLTAADLRVARELQQIPAIAALRQADGSFDAERYAQLLAAQGMSPAGFEARMRNQISVRQVESGIATSAFAPDAQADIALTAFFGRREIQVASFKSSDFHSKVTPTEAEIEAFYKANMAQFQAPETASIEYVVLDMEAVKRSIVVNEPDLREYYNQNVATLASKEQRRASHILIKVAKEAPATEREKARLRAVALQAQVKKSPDSFADVARKNSQDGSAEQGGDLDFFARGAMVKPFEDAVFSMKKGDISDVVETDFGFHIIKLTDIKGAKQPTYEEARANLEVEYKTQQAKRKFAEVAENFSNAVYEQADSFTDIAQRLKLEIKTAQNIQRLPALGAVGVLANPKFLEAVFSVEALEKKRNTEAIEVGANEMISARVTQHTSAHAQALSDVRVVVRNRLIAERAAELAKKEGAEKLALWKADAAAAKLDASVVVARDSAQSLPPQVLEAAFKVDPAKLPVWVGVDLGAEGYSVVKVSKVLPRADVSAESLKQQRSQYGQWLEAAEREAYYQSLKNLIKVDIKVARPVALKAETKVGE